MPYCHTCKKRFHPLGIGSHRAAHRSRHQLCKITYQAGVTWEHDFRRPCPECRGSGRVETLSHFICTRPIDACCMSPEDCAPKTWETCEACEGDGKVGGE